MVKTTILGKQKYEQGLVPWDRELMPTEEL